MFPTATTFTAPPPETLAQLRQVLEKRYPGAVIAGMESPPFRPLTEEEDAAAVVRINAARPDFVWVGLGAPKQERWMAAHRGKVQALMVGVGAAFDYEAGNIRRAPAWMQRCSLEWLYRLLQDPPPPLQALLCDQHQIHVVGAAPLTTFPDKQNRTFPRERPVCSFC